MARSRGKPITEKQLEANRENARKSTGPRTFEGKMRVALNAVKHGLDAGPMIESMARLEENPLDYIRILAALVESYRPRNKAQMMIVEDMAQLRLQRRRNQRAYAGKLALAVEELELHRARLRMQRRDWPELDREDEELEQAVLAEAGTGLGAFEAPTVAAPCEHAEPEEAVRVEAEIVPEPRDSEPQDSRLRGNDNPG